jgi:Putative mono-oxygenase ydhR
MFIVLSFMEPAAPVLAKVPGPISKIWLADEEKNTFGGFHLWESRTAMKGLQALTL